ncbi:MAG: hypothetical protein ABWY58_08415 [Aeromicrobium sp.]
MDDDALDVLLSRAAPTPSTRATETAARMTRERVRSAARPVWRRRRLVVLVGTACGTAVLAAAGSFSAYQLSIPPFQGTDPGTVRIDPGIPVNYSNSLGRRVECLAFMEFANITSVQQKALKRVATSPAWSGYGDRVLRDLDIPDATPEAQNEAIADIAARDLWRRAHEAVPSLVHMKESTGPVFHAFAMSCAKEGGVDGRP